MKEGLQALKSSGFAWQLKERQISIKSACRNLPWINSNRVETPWRRYRRTTHTRLPLLGPPISILQPPHDAKLRALMPLNVVSCAPRSNALITVEGLPVTCLFMRPQGEGTNYRTDFAENLCHLSRSNDQRLTKCFERLPQLLDRLSHPPPMPLAHIWRCPHVWLKHIEREHGASLSRFS